MLSYLCTEEGYAMKRRMWMALMLALVLALPCFAMAEDEAFVIKKWDSYKKLAAMLDEAGKPAVVDITKQAISLSQLEQLHADYPETRFLYRLRVFKKNYLWDSDELDFGWNEFKDMDEMMAYLQYFPNVTSVKCLGSLFTGDEMERSCVLMADKTVVDFWESVKHRNSSTIARMANDANDQYQDFVPTAEVGEILNAQKTGRENDEEIIYYNPVGAGVLDMMIVHRCYEQAKQQGKGQTLVLWDGEE